MKNTICFNSNSFIGNSVLIATSIIVAAIYFTMEFSKERRELQMCLSRSALPPPVQEKTKVIVVDGGNKRDSDISYPSNQYIPRDNSFEDFQSVGYIFNDSGRFPLFMNRVRSRYYYYTRDDSRNNIKVTIGDPDHGLKDEYYDGDTLTVPELSTMPFTAKIYTQHLFR